VRIDAVYASIQSRDTVFE
jgi:hypothetical protein